MRYYQTFGNSKFCDFLLLRDYFSFIKNSYTSVGQGEVMELMLELIRNLMQETVNELSKLIIRTITKFATIERKFCKLEKVCLRYSSSFSRALTDSLKPKTRRKKFSVKFSRSYISFAIYFNLKTFFRWTNCWKSDGY